jgi:hypothetical protein
VGKGGAAGAVVAVGRPVTLVESVILTAELSSMVRAVSVKVRSLASAMVPTRAASIY